MFQYKHAFTLIELLVVVLIIGILAAVAVPQYQVAVAKSRFTQGIALCDAIYKAQKVYQLSNGNYTDQFSDLDVDLPSGGAVSEAGNQMDYAAFKIRLAKSDPYCAVWSMGTNTPAYYFYYRGRKDCRAHPDKTVANQVCKGLGGSYVWNYSSSFEKVYVLQWK